MVRNFLLELSASTQVISRGLDVTNLAKGQCKFYRSEYVLGQSHMTMLIKSLTNVI